MASKDVSASARFVSIDTHPANCSLVITYEVPIDATEPKMGHELPHGSKRDQFQINISPLDKLTRDDLERVKGAVPFDIRQLGEEILAQYPVLSDGGDLTKTLEDIQLNILYLFNRKQAQLYQSTTSKPSRPPSSTGSGRLASARAGSARGWASGKTDTATRANKNYPMDIYNRLCAKHFEQSSGRVSHTDMQTLDEFGQQMDTHLDGIELEFQPDRVSKSQVDDLESLLEDLYGNQEERRRSMTTIRQFIRQSEEKLTSASSNRLLVCAMLRTLRDCDGTQDYFLSKSILYCLIRFTSIEDLNEHMAPGKTNLNSGGAGDWPELVRIVLELLEKQTKWLNRCEDLRQIVPYYTNALLALLRNLMREKVGQNNLKSILILQYGNTLADILVGMLEALSKVVARYLRAPNEHYERLLSTLRLTLGIILQLVIFKEFALLLRASLSRAQSLVNSTVSLLNTLQVCRPASGTVQQQQQQHQMLINDQATLLQIYELELELLKLITFLTYDTRFKVRLVRKSLLLKCVLSYLVVFLTASRKSNSLRPFDRSPVLMVPFKCLYELSCNDQIKQMLFRSKIIMKCLLEYLLIAATDLTAELEGCAHGPPRVPAHAQANLDLHDYDQIVLEPANASHYILGFWINLSARNVAPIYHLDESNQELKEPICDYLKLVAGHLLTFMRLVEAQDSSGSQPTKALHLGVYVHAKLLRNLSQFLQPPGPGDESLKSISRSIHLMLVRVKAGRCQEFTPLAVESLAILTNFLNNQSMASGSLDNDDDDDDDDDSRLYLKSILEELFGERGLFVGGLAESEHENDDLLLVSINFLGAWAQNREICAELRSIQSNLLNMMNAILELKQTDNETLISCLFTLRQLMNHSSFMQGLGQSLDRQRNSEEQQALILVDGLSLLVMHPDASVVRLANSILDMLKQFEQFYTLNESITCQHRFAAYNSKWLGAIKANRDDPRDNLIELQSNNQHQEETNRRLNDNEDYNQLRTIHEIGTQSTFSSCLSKNNSLNVDSIRQNDKSGDQNDESDEDEADNNDLDEEEEETSSEPDLNVIDDNSMIKHLTNRRESRTELLRR